MTKEQKLIAEQATHIIEKIKADMLVSGKDTVRLAVLEASLAGIVLVLKSISLAWLPTFKSEAEYDEFRGEFLEACGLDEHDPTMG